MSMGRLIDIPYDTSPPLIFTFQQTANLLAGQYSFTGMGVAKIAFTPDRPILQNVLYIFNTISFAMDISPLDYSAAIATQPNFSAYVQSDAAAPAFRETIALPNYFANLKYVLALLGGQEPGQQYPGSTGSGTVQPTATNRLLGSVSGVLNQVGTLIGKNSITATIQMTAQEIVDPGFIECFKSHASPVQRGIARVTGAIESMF